MASKGTHSHPSALSLKPGVSLTGRERSPWPALGDHPTPHHLVRATKMPGCCRDVNGPRVCHTESQKEENKCHLCCQSLSPVRCFVTPWTAARQSSLSFTVSQSVLRLMSIELVMPSNHLTLCPPLLLQQSIFPSVTVFSNESALRIRWPEYWSFSFSISLPMNMQNHVLMHIYGI